MRWLVEFHNERRGILARYGVEAPLPAAAILLGRNAAFRGVSTGSSATEAELVRAGRARRGSRRKREGSLPDREQPARINWRRAG
jgi:hypothetical protein